MQDIIEKYRSIVIQIATPYSTGTGFLLQGAAVIVTNYQVVQDNREVVVEGSLLPRQMAQVVFTDPKHDLALVALPIAQPLPKEAGAVLAEGRKVASGDKVVAIGHPFGLKYAANKGLVSSTEQLRGGLRYIQHDAVMNPANNGGPLVNHQGDVIGINSCLVSEAENFGFALPVGYLSETLAVWEQGGGKLGTRCGECASAVFEQTVEVGNCHNCSASIELPNAAPLYEPTGIARTVEEILRKCGHDVKLARRGPNVWEVASGSAKIFISYYEPNGLIAGDAILCDLPATDLMAIYEFLLRKNYEMEALSLSVRGQEIVLSLVIYDRYLTLDIGMKLFKNLFVKADELDNVLVEQFGGGWKGDNL